MNLSPENKLLLDELLSNDEEAVKRALSVLPAMKPDQSCLRALEMFWQLNPDEDLRAEAGKILKTLEKPKELKNVEGSFAIFRSLSEILPWMDENAAEIQKKNFAVFAKQLNNYEYFLSKYPIYTDVLLDAGRKLYMLFQLETEAALCFETIIKYNPENDEALYAIGRMAEKKGEADKALEYYEKSISLNPANNYAQMQAGILKSTVFDRQQEAIDHFNKVIEEDPYSVEPYIRIAEACYHLNDYARCRQYLEIAMGINEYHEEALNLQGLLQWKVENDYEKAIASFQKGIDHRIHNDSALLLKSLGDIHAQQLQDYYKARVFYEKSLKINPGQKAIIQQFIPILLRTFQDLDAVVQCYENYLQKVPADAEIKAEYAAFLVEYLHDYEAAFQQLKMALEINPQLAEAEKLMARIANYVNEPDSKETEAEEDDDEDFEFEEIDIDFDDDEEKDDDDDDFTGGSAAGDF